MKDEFYSQLKEFLKSLGFTESEGKWTRNGSFSEPGQTMIVNGQRYSQPGRTIEIQIIITMVGTILTGLADDPEDTWNGPEMAQINLLRTHNGDEVFNLDLGVEYDDLTYIEQNITSLINA